MSDTADLFDRREDDRANAYFVGVFVVTALMLVVFAPVVVGLGVVIGAFHGAWWAWRKIIWQGLVNIWCEAEE